METTQIHAAIRDHGAKQVYDAAHARMSGDRKSLEKLGLIAETIADAVQIASIAYDNLGAAVQAIDFAQAQAKLDGFAK